VGSKNEVLILRSVNSIVMAPASTGRDSSNSRAVIVIDHTNRGILSGAIPFDRMLMVVEMKLMAPRIEETPAKCNEKIAKSTAAPEWAMLPDSGG